MLIEVFLSSVLISVLKGITLLVSYINNNSFPPTLSKEEELRCLGILGRSHTNQALTDEEINMVEHARNKLIEHNLRLVAFIVKKYDSTGEQDDDLISIGIIGLIKGINTFNCDKGARLATYAGRCIHNEILMYLRYIKKRKVEVSIYEPIGYDKEGNVISLIDNLSADTEPILDKIVSDSDQRILLEKLEKLPLLERQVLQMRFGLKNKPRQTQRKIGEYLGISRSYVSRIEKRALQILNDLMNENKP